MSGEWSRAEEVTWDWHMDIHSDTATRGDPVLYAEWWPDGLSVDWGVQIVILTTDGDYVSRVCGTSDDAFAFFDEYEADSAFVNGYAPIEENEWNDAAGDVDYEVSEWDADYGSDTEGY